MVSFIDRVEEMRSLKRIRAASAAQSQMVVVYGRRRAGKTRLLQELLRANKGAYLFVGTKNEKMVLDDLSRALSEPLGIAPKIESWEDFFELLFTKKLLVVLDEFPNILKVNPAAVTEFQRLWDARSRSGGAMLVLVGSYVGTMKRLFFDDRQPLFGRAAFKLDIRPFDFSGTCEYLKAMGIDDIPSALRIYSVLGGVPFYLNYLDFTDKSRFIPQLFYDFPAPLAEEGKNVLVLEFGSEQKGYFSILEALAEGKTAPKLISDRTGMPPDTVHKYLHELTEVYGILGREHPAGEKGSRKDVRYRIADNFFDFWFRFVYPGRVAPEEELSAYLGPAFERIVSELIGRRFPKFPEQGRWWSGKEEIDIVAINREGGEILFCECKSGRKPMTREQLEDLVRKSALVSWRKGRRKEHFMVVSAGGFTTDCLAMMRERSVAHWTLRDIADMTSMKPDKEA
jgi:AAA+ ATPase superfamily predicted ATPase